MIDAGLQAEGLVGSLAVGGQRPGLHRRQRPGDDRHHRFGGTGQDVAIAALWDDMWLFKGDLRTAVYREVLSGSLGVRFQLYNYFAFLARYGQSIAIRDGLGLRRTDRSDRLLDHCSESAPPPGVSGLPGAPTLPSSRLVS